MDAETSQRIQSFIGVAYEELTPIRANKSSVSEKEKYKQQIEELKKIL